ncbi:MAG: hypothetical protein QM734_01625 [Cyclobacteriaceae bacterium]
MVNRYEGEIHINPIRVLRNGDFNNDGHIKDIDVTLNQAVELNQKISERLIALRSYFKERKFSGIQFRFAEVVTSALKGYLILN